MRDLMRRLERLETATPRLDPILIWWRGDSELFYARVGGERIYRQPGETEAQFVDRARDRAKVNGIAWLERAPCAS